MIAKMHIYVTKSSESANPSKKSEITPSNRWGILKRKQCKNSQHVNTICTHEICIKHEIFSIADVLFQVDPRLLWEEEDPLPFSFKLNVPDKH